MDGHAVPLTGVVGLLAGITFAGSGGIMSTAREELPNPCISQLAKSLVETSWKENNVTMYCHIHCLLVQRTWCTFRSTMQKKPLLFVIWVKIAYISNKSPFVGMHGFQMMGFVGSCYI